MKCGLLGRTLSHSYSPQIHSMLGDYSYSLWEHEPEDLADFLKNGDWDGLNVTVPYKKDVIPYLDELTPIAAKLGAVNTIVRRKEMAAEVRPSLRAVKKQEAKMATPDIRKETE